LSILFSKLLSTIVWHFDIWERKNMTNHIAPIDFIYFFGWQNFHRFVKNILEKEYSFTNFLKFFGGGSSNEFLFLNHPKTSPQLPTRPQRVLKRLSTFIFPMSSNLAHSTYGWSPLEKCHKFYIKRVAELTTTVIIIQ